MPKKARSKLYRPRKHKQSQAASQNNVTQSDENNIRIFNFNTAEKPHPVNLSDQQSDLEPVPIIRKTEATQVIYHVMSTVQMDHDYLAAEHNEKEPSVLASSSANCVLKTSNSSTNVNFIPSSQEFHPNTIKKLPTKAPAKICVMQNSQYNSENSSSKTNPSFQSLTQSLDDEKCASYPVSPSLTLSVEGGLPTLRFCVAHPCASDEGESDVLKITKFPVSCESTMENSMDSIDFPKENMHSSELTLPRRNCEDIVQSDIQSNTVQSMPVITSCFSLDGKLLHSVSTVTKLAESTLYKRKSGVKLVRKISPANALKPDAKKIKISAPSPIVINAVTTTAVTTDPVRINSVNNTDTDHGTSGLFSPTLSTNQSLPIRGKLYDAMSSLNHSQINTIDDSNPCPYYTNDVNCTTVRAGEFVELMGAQVVDKNDVHRYLLALKGKLEHIMPTFWSVVLNTWGIHCASLSMCKNIQVQRSVVVQLSGKMQIFALGKYLPKGHELREFAEQKSLVGSNVDDLAEEVVAVIRDINRYNICRAVHKHREYWTHISECYEEMCSDVEKTLRSEKCDLLVKNVMVCAQCKQIQTRLKSVVSRHSKGSSEVKDQCSDRYMTEEQLREKLKKKTKEIRRQNRSIARLRRKLELAQKGTDQSQQKGKILDQQDLEELLFGDSESDFDWPEENGETW